MRRWLLGLIAALAVIAIGAVLLLPRDWRTHTSWSGPWGTKTVTVAESEVVDDIRALNRLVVFRAYLTATTTTHEIGWITQTDQTMLTPAFVNYYVDMAAITPRLIALRGNILFVALPPLTIERPNIDTLHVRIFNDGLFGQFASTSERLRIANNRMALAQLFDRARMPFLVDAARQAAIAAVTANVRTALDAAGHRDLAVRVIA